MYLIYGPDPKSIVERYTTITGKPALPPAWTFGLWLSTSFTTEYDEATVTSFLDGMAERDIPVSAFHFDCFWMPGFKWCDYEFDKDYFPDAKGQLERIKKRGIHVRGYCMNTSSALTECRFVYGSIPTLRKRARYLRRPQIRAISSREQTAACGSTTFG